jgi:hypothetical protein
MAVAIMSPAARAGVLTSDNLPTMTWSVDGAPESAWSFSPTLDMFAPAAGGGYQLTSSPTFSSILDNRAGITIQMLTFDPDPFVLNNILVTNTTSSTQVFSAFVGVPTTFAAPNIISGVIEVGVIDGGDDGATLATAGTPIYQAQIDGVTVDTLLDEPFSLVAGSAGVNSATASFGPDTSGVAVTSNIGIQLRFSLTPGDTASILSRFDVVAIPSPAALPAFGIAALCLPKRRRRTS